MSEIVGNLSKATGLRSVDIVRIMNRAPNMYRTYPIQKRTGGTREIAQPAREVKYVQRALIEILLKDLPIHESATAYRKGLSILDNAYPHRGDGPILKLDLKEFFPSIKSNDWIAYCKDKNIDLDEEEIQLTSRLMFYRRDGARTLRLAIGAPTSPMLSNILMHDFDCKILQHLENDKVVYTRYADDMTFSAPRTGYLNGVMKTVSTAIREVKYPRVSINRKKTTHVTRRYGRSVTGLTLSNDGRVTIGRDNKRKLNASVHRAKTGKSSAEEMQILAGMLAYVNAVEPTFLATLKKKYGEDVILNAQRSVTRAGRLGPHAAPFARDADSTPAVFPLTFGGPDTSS